MSGHEQHPPERMELILSILDNAFASEGRFTIRPPASVLQDYAILNSATVLQQLAGTEWLLRFSDGAVQPLYFDDLLVLVYNMRRLAEARELAKRELKEKGLAHGQFEYSASANLSEILQLHSVQHILRSVQLELGPARDPASPESTITEIFNQQRIDKCSAVYQRIHNTCVERGFFDCRIVADEPVENQAIEELAKNYLAIGVGNDLARLPFMDSLIVLEMLKQYRAYTQGRKPEGDFSITFKLRTAFTESEVFRLLDDLRCLGILIERDAAA
jgi:hypothetical protein